MSDDDDSAYERFEDARMSPAATALEKKQLKQKLFEEHPQLRQLFLARRGLTKSLNPEALAFLGRVVNEDSLPTDDDGEVDREQLIDFLKKWVGNYQQLSEGAKESLQRTFPAVIALIQRELTNDEIFEVVGNSDA